jgi:UDPglucose--hexose-1-phosphate uridylyltransferase
VDARAEDAVSDRRDAAARPPRGASPELRRDPVVDRWVVIAPERRLRPFDFGDATAGVAPPPCPFCPGHEHLTLPETLALDAAGRADAGAEWSVRVVPNRFPAFVQDGVPVAVVEGLRESVPGVGAHEVIVETRAHDARLERLDEGPLALVLRAVRERLRAYAEDPRLVHALPFKNHGVEAGASLRHPHTQLVATPLVPVAVAQEMDGAARYYERRGRCLYCDGLEEEERIGERGRWIDERDGFVTLAPFAARFPFETWLLPREHASRFEAGDETQDRALARALRDLLRRLAIALDDPPYNLVLHTAPLRSAELAHYHWHIEVMPMRHRIGGFEWGSGLFINSTPPEEAARALRALAPRAETAIAESRSAPAPEET